MRKFDYWKIKQLINKININLEMYELNKLIRDLGGNPII